MGKFYFVHLGNAFASPPPATIIKRAFFIPPYKHSRYSPLEIGKYKKILLGFNPLRSKRKYSCEELNKNRDISKFLNFLFFV